jgi:hypothetical protein
MSYTIPVFLFNSVLIIQMLPTAFIVFKNIYIYLYLQDVYNEIPRFHRILKEGINRDMA